MRLINLMRECKELSHAKHLHSEIVKAGFNGDRFIGNFLIQMYGNCGSVEGAHAVFDGLHSANDFSWNILLSAYARNGHLEQVRRVLQKMPQFTVVAWNAVLAAYAQRGHMKEAKSAFDQMQFVDVFSWTTMITAYADIGQMQEAKSLFDCMLERNLVSWTALLMGYARNSRIPDAIHVFNRMPQTDVVSWNSVITGYSENGQALDAKLAFDSMPSRSVVSWTALTAAYAGDKNVVKAGEVFMKMPEHNLVSWTTMITANAESGQVQPMQMFDVVGDVVSWTAVIGAYAQNGEAKTALQMFEYMALEGVLPNQVTFMNVFSACRHDGLVCTGREYFHSLQRDYGLVPTDDHYECMVDLLGRIGHLDKAEDLINSMPSEPDALTWMTLLGACKVHTETDRGACVAKKVAECQPDNAAPYVLMSSMYREAGKSDEASSVRKVLTDRGLKNVPGQSWILANLTV